MKGYMCSVDYDEHLGTDFYGVPVYSSLNGIKAHRKCVREGECGIYEVEVKKVRVRKKEKISG